MSLALDVAVPPAVVFDLYGDGNRDIYRVALDGGDLVRLTTNAADDRDATVADGVVVFTSYRDRNAELYSLPLAGGTERRLTTTSTVQETEPALARAGGRLAFASTATGVSKLWTAASDASGAARATATFGFAGSIEGTPSWSPAGDQVVFVSTSSGVASLFVLTPATTAAPMLLAGGGVPNVEPVWSPDGRSVAFASEREGNTDIYLVDVQSQAVQRLTQRAGTDAQPAWLPDGRLVYVSWVDGVPRLRWLDPNAPESVYEIDTGPGAAQRPSPVY